MKKTLFSSVLVAAMLLTACGGASNSASIQSVPSPFSSTSAPSSSSLLSISSAPSVPTSSIPSASSSEPPLEIGHSELLESSNGWDTYRYISTVSGADLSPRPYPIQITIPSFWVPDYYLPSKHLDTKDGVKVADLHRCYVVAPDIDPFEFVTVNPEQLIEYGCSNYFLGQYERPDGANVFWASYHSTYEEPGYTYSYALQIETYRYFRLTFYLFDHIEYPPQVNTELLNTIVNSIVPL